MKSKILAEITATIARHNRAVRNLQRLYDFIDSNGHLAEAEMNELGQTVYLCPDHSDCSISVYTREELQALMTLAPKWEKSKGYSSIRYTAKVFECEDHWCGNDTKSQYTIVLHARDDALPPTCKVVEVEEVVPAQPEMKVRRTQVVCEL